MGFRDRFRRKRSTTAGTITTHYRVGGSYPTYIPDYPTSNVGALGFNNEGELTVGIGGGLTVDSDGDLGVQVAPGFSVELPGQDPAPADCPPEPTQDQPQDCAPDPEPAYSDPSPSYDSSSSYDSGYSDSGSSYDSGSSDSGGGGDW